MYIVIFIKVSKIYLPCKLKANFYKPKLLIKTIVISNEVRGEIF